MNLRSTKCLWQNHMERRIIIITWIMVWFLFCFCLFVGQTDTCIAFLLTVHPARLVLFCSWVLQSNLEVNRYICLSQVFSCCFCVESGSGIGWLFFGLFVCCIVAVVCCQSCFKMVLSRQMLPNAMFSLPLSTVTNATNQFFVHSDQFHMHYQCCCFCKTSISAFV